MEDWKAVVNFSNIPISREDERVGEELVGEDGSIIKEATDEYIVADIKGPQDQQDNYEIQSQANAIEAEVQTRRTRGSLKSQAISNPNMNVLDWERDDWFEHDSALRKSKETAHTLIEKDCAAEDVIRVWEEIAKFITVRMLEGRAVVIAGLGLFTYKVHKLPVNHKVFKITKIPVFLISNHLSLMYQLVQERPLTSNAPVFPLNLSVIANETRLPRALVEGVITEVLQAFARAVICNKSLELPFPAIGKLQIKKQRVNFRFYDEFCLKLGYNVAGSRVGNIAAENTIPGRMTPLKLHIPTESYRSVLHLREVRSVHEDSLPVPLVKVDGKYVPITLACAEKAASNSQQMPPEMISDASDNEAFCSSNKAAGILEESEDDRNIFQREMEKVKMRDMRLDRRDPPGIWKPQPLYKPQTTGDCVLNAMNNCPKVMTQCMRAHMYRVFVDTLGLETVKSHFRRRDNQGLQRQISFTKPYIFSNPASDRKDSDTDPEDKGMGASLMRMPSKSL